MVSYNGTVEGLSAYIETAIADAKGPMDTQVAVVARDTALKVFEGFALSQEVRVNAVWDADDGFHMSLQKM